MRRFTESLGRATACGLLTVSAYAGDAVLGNYVVDKQVDCIQDLDETEVDNTFTVNDICVKSVEEHWDLGDTLDLVKLGSFAAAVYFGRRAFKDRQREKSEAFNTGQLFIDSATAVVTERLSHPENKDMTAHIESVRIIWPEPEEPQIPEPASIVL